MCRETDPVLSSQVAANFDGVWGNRWRAREAERARVGGARGVRDNILGLYFAPSEDSRDEGDERSEDIEGGEVESLDLELAKYADRSLYSLAVFVVLFVAWVVTYSKIWEDLPDWLLVRSVSQGERSGW